MFYGPKLVMGLSHDGLNLFFHHDMNKNLRDTLKKDEEYFGILWFHF